QRGQRAVGQGVQAIQQVLKVATCACAHQLLAIDGDGKNRVQRAHVERDVSVCRNVAPGVTGADRTYGSARMALQNLQNFSLRLRPVAVAVPLLVAPKIDDFLKNLFPAGIHLQGCSGKSKKWSKERTSNSVPTRLRAISRDIKAKNSTGRHHPNR